MSQIQELDSNSLPTQALIKTLNKKPGLKDTNFQVLKARLEAVKYIAENCTFSTYVINRLIKTSVIIVLILVQQLI